VSVVAMTWGDSVQAHLGAEHPQVGADQGLGFRVQGLVFRA